MEIVVILFCGDIFINDNLIILVINRHAENLSMWLPRINKNMMACNQ